MYFQPNDENYKLCLQFAWSHVKHHRYLSVSSHEVRRDIEGICEKLKINNFHDEQKQFKNIVEDLVCHELAVNHYTKDAMYSIINLLTTLAYDPINRLKEKKRRGLTVFQKIKKFEEIDSKDGQIIVKSLLEDNFKLLKNETDSELSEWTESSDDEQQKSTDESDSEAYQSKSSTSTTLKPPQKPKVFTNFSFERIENEKWLNDNLQNSWWRPNEVYHCEINSTHPAASFCLDWQKHLTKRSLGFIKPQSVSLLSENCLLREIFWMFANAVDCKFFKFSKNEISVRPNVSMPSTTTQTLHIFLNEFVKSMKIMHALKQEIEKAFKNGALSHTLENYYRMLQIFLDDIIEFLIEQEDCVKSQANVYTILTLHSKFREHSQMLSMLWDIHTTSVLDEDKYPPHIRSAFLIASLNYHVFHSTHKCKKNLSISFLLVCLQSYLKIFETWWTEARLQDLKMEFLVEKVLSNENEIVQPRLFEKCKEKAFYINDVVANRISQDPIIGTMHFYAMEASVTLETISKLDRVHEMKQIKNTSKSLYDEFIERINREIKNLASNDISFNQNGDDENADKPREFSKNQKIVDDIKNGMTEEGDEMMLLIFNSTFEDLTSIDGSRNTTESPSQLDIYKKLNKATNSILLPLENSIQRHLNELLMKKISIAERFVMDIFFNELLVEQFLQEIRKVFFLESHELMNYFNMKLFPLMENGDSSWANSYLMTMTLNEAIRSGRQYSTLFTVQVNKKLGHLSVFDAIDEIEIHVNMNSIFENIFTLESMSKYNEGNVLTSDLNFKLI